MRWVVVLALFWIFIGFELVCSQFVVIEDSRKDACLGHEFLENVIWTCVVSQSSGDVYIMVKARNLVNYDLTYDQDPNLDVYILATPQPAPDFITVKLPSDSSNINRLIGIALDGVPIYSALNENYEDIFGNGVDVGTNDRVDHCGGSYGPTPNGDRYHYRLMPTCITYQGDAMSKRKQFIDDIHDLLIYFASVPSRTLLGYSLAGHPIYSPYSRRGLLESGLDSCNGKFVNSTYEYYVTPSFPYILGCEGPGVYSLLDVGVSVESLPSKIGHQYTTCPGGYYPSTDFESNGCVPCPAGRFSTTSYAVSSSRPPCNEIAPLGYYSNEGSNQPIKCPSGRYGDSLGMTDSSCSGPCNPGYYCPAGSTSASAFACGNASLYCPPSTLTRYPVELGYYSTPLDVDSLFRSSQTRCEPGYYCQNGLRYPCPAGTYGLESGLFAPNCSSPCPMGNYCPENSITPILCPAGRYGSVTSLTSSGCSGPCHPGHWCPAGSTSPFQEICAAGIYGAEEGLSTPECNSFCEVGGAPNATSSQGTKFCPRRVCQAGYFCPAGSIRSDQIPCGREDLYCPPETVVPLNVSDGYYTIDITGGNGNDTAAFRVAQLPCEPGYFCQKGLKYPCPPGHYGSDWGISNSSCNGYCTPGFRCLSASPLPDQYTCDSGPNFYCPLGSYQSIEVPPGYYSIGTSLITRGSIAPCLPGSYCTLGLAELCPAGRYSISGSSTIECDGLCQAGYYCLPGSSSPQQYRCPAGRYGVKGMTSSLCQGACLGGYYCPENSTTPYQFECGSEYLYCPPGSGAPIAVSPSHFSTGGNSTTRVAQVYCDRSNFLNVTGAEELLCPSTTVLL